MNNAQDQINHSASSRGSWSPGLIDSLPMKVVEGIGSNRHQSYTDGSKRQQFDMGEYLKLQRDEDLLFERFRQQQRINSGGLLLCNQMYF